MPFVYLGQEFHHPPLSYNQLQGQIRGPSPRNDWKAEGLIIEQYLELARRHRNCGPGKVLQLGLLNYDHDYPISLKAWQL